MSSKNYNSPFLLAFLAFLYLFQICGIPFLHHFELVVEEECHCALEEKQIRNEYNENSPCDDEHDHHHSKSCSICSSILGVVSSCEALPNYSFYFELLNKSSFISFVKPEHRTLILLRTRSPPLFLS